MNASEGLAMTASLSKPENELTVAMKESHRTSRWSPWRNGSLNSLRGFRKTSCSSGARPYELRIKTDRQNRISANNQAVQYSVRTSHPPRSWEPHPRKTAWYPKLESCCGGQSRWSRAIRTLQGPKRQKRDGCQNLDWPKAALLAPRLWRLGTPCQELPARRVRRSRAKNSRAAL